MRHYRFHLLLVVSITHLIFSVFLAAGLTGLRPILLEALVFPLQSHHHRFDPENFSFDSRARQGRISFDLQNA